MGDVIGMDGITTLALQPDKVLEAAVGEVEEVLVLGWEEDGTLYAAASIPDAKDILFVIEVFKKKLLDGDYE